MSKLPLLLVLLYVLPGLDLSLVAAEEPLPRVPATEPGEAVNTIRLQNGFRAELIAAEPLVNDPIAIQYDENGRAYVVEMIDYPYSDKAHDQAWEEQTSEPLGRVRLLTDTDGDGAFDESTVFADKLSWPSGVALWKGGVYVAATPDVWYFKDTDGDGKADVRRKVFSGFRKYNVQAVMNNFQWGLDHRIYAAGSGNGGNVESETADGNPVRMGRNDFRFNPLNEQFELISGGARFGNTQDDWGNRFLCNIRNPVQHVVLPARYLKRNPFLPVASAIHDAARSGDTIAVYQISPPEAWRAINAKRLAANTATKSPFDSTVPSGYITSSSGVTIYRGAAYGPDYYGNAFIGEVAGNLVMRYKLKPDGVTFEANRAHEKVEFLASTDNWFRPVNFANAPDGTLHVLDMYRETIEHPWSMPDDLKARVDLTSGRDRGRIYRIVPPEYPAGFTPPPAPRLGSASTAELVAHLENPNSWWRETAHRLIFERQDETAIAPLRALLREGKTPQARLHALWSLEGLGALEEGDVGAALNDDDPHLREHAVRLAEPRLNDSAALLELVLKRVADENAGVRFQTAFTLGEVKDDKATAALADIARRDAGDEWIRTAVLSSLADSSVPFLLDVLGDSSFVATVPGRQMIGQLAFVASAANGGKDVDKVLAALSRFEGDAAIEQSLEDVVVMNVGAALKRVGRNLTERARDDSPGGRLLSRKLKESQKTALDGEAGIAARQAAIRLIGYGSFESARPTLTELLDARQPQQVQSAAIAALAGFPDKEVAELLLEKYPALTPTVQADVVARLLSRVEWIVALFDAIEARVVPITRISPVRRDIYMKSGYPAIRERAIKLFAGELPGPRREVIAEYQSSLKLQGDRLRGEKVFRRECLNCHKLGKEGHEVGPNLTTIQNRTPAQLLVNVLDPNREVSPDFLEYIVVASDGRTTTGIIAAETPSGLTLRQAEGKQQTILRADIEEFRSSGKSLMPEGLEKKIKPQEMADLLAYLLSLKK